MQMSAADNAVCCLIARSGSPFLYYFYFLCPVVEVAVISQNEGNKTEHKNYNVNHVTVHPP